MAKYIIKRILLLIPITLGITILIFTIMYFTPGDPVEILLGGNATEAQIEAMRETLGLDQPYLVQLFNYCKDLFLHFNFGDSFTYQTPVLSEIMTRMPYTFLVALLCMFIQIVVGIPLGIYAAVHHNKLGDRISMVLSVVGISMPQFWLALLMVILFAVKLGWLPPFGVGGIKYWIMPIVANSLMGVAQQARQTRSSMLEVIRSDYITTAKAKGASERSILFRHALPNALIPVVTIIGNGLGAMLGGALIVETVFSIPGIGSYMMMGINNRDYPIVRGCVIFLGIVFAFIMLLVDVVYAYIDPRIKAQFEGGKKRRKKGGNEDEE